MSIGERMLFLIGLAAGLCCAVATFMWGQWVGERDVQLRAKADRHSAVALCREQDAIAILITGPHADADRWQCVGGSGRMLRRTSPLASPLAAPQPHKTLRP